MNRLTKVSILALVLSFGATLCHAGGLGGLQPGVRGGLYQDSEDLFVGADVKFNVLMLSADPSVEYVFVDGATVMTFNADAFVSVLNLPLVSGWVGGGVGLMYVKPDEGDSSEDPLVNAVAGVGFSVPFSPYVMVKWVFADENDGFVVAAGIRF